MLSADSTLRQWIQCSLTLRPKELVRTDETIQNYLLTLLGGHRDQCPPSLQQPSAFAPRDSGGLLTQSLIFSLNIFRKNEISNKNDINM